MSGFRGLVLALALVSGEAAAQTATRTPPPFPPAMDLPETPWVAPTRALYEQLTAPSWTPAHEMTARAPNKRGRLFCDRQTGSARVRYANGTELRIVDVSCGGASSAVVRGFYFATNGEMWIGDLLVSRGGLDAAQANRGVYRFPNGNFVISDRTNPNGYWRAFGSPSGQMLVSVEEAGLFVSERLPMAGRTTTLTVAAPWVRTRWILPGIGYFEGMSDYFNGFRFDGLGALDAAQPGSPYVTGGEPYHGSFTAIDGSYRITGPMVWRGGDNIPWLDRFAVSAASSEFGTPYEGGMTFRPEDGMPVRIETRVDTVLGPPGLYRAYSNVAPGRLERALAAPEGAAPPPGAHESLTRTNWTPSLLHMFFTDLNPQTTRAYWRAVFRQSDAARQTAYDEQAEAQRVHGERVARREQRQAQDRATFAAAMNDVMADLGNQAQRSVYDMQRQAVINQQAVDAASGGGVVGASPPMTYDEWTAYQQAQVDNASSRQTADSGSSLTTGGGSSGSRPSPSAPSDSEEAEPLTQQEVRQLMYGRYTQEGGLQFDITLNEVTVVFPEPGEYQRHDAGQRIVTDMEVTSFESNAAWARMQGTGTCRHYQGYLESGERDLRIFEPCRWIFNVDHRDRTLGFGAPSANVGNGQRRW